MRSNNILGIVFSNVHDDLVSELTDSRSMASIPFGSRYRLVDFSVSNLVNAGVSRVAVMATSNYRSLMNHLGTGKAWDLDRKWGGLYIMPPFNLEGAGYSVGHIDSLFGIKDFILSSPVNYVVLCDADVVANVDLRKVFATHLKNNADVTFCYKNGPLPHSHCDIMAFDLDKNNRITEITLPDTPGDNKNFCLDIAIMEKKLLVDLVTRAHEQGKTSFSSDVFLKNADTLKMYGYEIKEYAAVIDSPQSYVKASFDLLNRSVQSELLNPERPVYTKTLDSMPTRYGPDSSVCNSLIADGCIIEGTVKNSILFRNVHIGKNSVIEDSIIMQDSIVEDNVRIKNVTTDKNVTVKTGCTLNGSQNYNLFIKKGETVL